MTIVKHILYKFISRGGYSLSPLKFKYMYPATVCATSFT
ncbi:hypothetical protein VCHA50P416_20303 [Vibrio chagasii]|nr:hypothetical protein VCHA42P256_20234 [Vibrio chagasii]CAH7175547.1 hypothetical protein VCHA43P272_20302 [Vibrio chagasii]CAH7368556.1 hypothetical protein VCHA50P416_20303 [Vibrio chagasii]